jgi:hypothetical protein
LCHDLSKKSNQIFQRIARLKNKTAFSTADERGFARIFSICGNLRSSADKNRLVDFTFSV